MKYAPADSAPPTGTPASRAWRRCLLLLSFRKYDPVNSAPPTDTPGSRTWRPWPLRRPFRKYDPVNSAPPTGTPGSRTWRPWPLRRPFLVGFIVLCIVLCIGIELVLLGCAVGGCHVFGKYSYELSTASYFTYNQLPTVLSLILSLLWAIPHHDIMRLEPYFRMSAPGGTSAVDSIFLNYPYTFAAFVPYVAWKRRHYHVMLSSCIALTMAFLVTPLIAGIFDDARLPRLVSDTSIRGALRPVNENSRLSNEFTHAAYRTNWLNGSFPAFTNSSYAVLPVYNTTEIVGNENWTAATTLYESELTCERTTRINITFSDKTGINVNITSQDGAYHVNLCDQKRKNVSQLLYIANLTQLQYIADLNTAAQVSLAPQAAQSSRASQFSSASQASVASVASVASQSQVLQASQTSPPNNQGGSTFLSAQSGRNIPSGNKRDRSLSGLSNPPIISTRSDEGNSTCHGFTTFITPWTAIAQQVLVGPALRNGSHVYLYGWASGSSPSWPSTDSSPPTNITALFCTTHYYSQTVTMTFGMPDGKLIEFNRTGVREPFVNFPNFDGIINGQTTALATPIDAMNSAGDIFGLGYRPAQAPNPDSQLQRRFGVRPKDIRALFVVLGENHGDRTSHSTVYIDNVNGLPGLALSEMSPDNLEELLDPKKLEAVYDRALRTMFALAVTEEMVDRHGNDTVPVLRSIYVRGFKVNILWARGAQGWLLLVVMMATLLTVLMERRPCNLDGEPNSLAEALRLLAASPEVSAEMENAEFHNPKDLVEVFNDGRGRYTLDLVPGQGPRVLRTSAVRKHSRLPAPGRRNQEPWVVQLWQLRNMAGVGFLTFFGVVGVLLSVAFGYSQSTNGLPMLAPLNSFRYKVLFSYIPIAIGMASEPILITIATCQCMLAPYRMLTRGSPTSSKALAVDFDKSPPHFQIVRSLRTRNVPLAALTVSILLCNVLAVALAGLFSVTVRRVDTTTELLTYPAAALRGGFTLPTHDMYFLLAEQLSGHARALPFTTSEYYVVPVLPIDLQHDRVERYETSTIGIGLNVSCELVPKNSIHSQCEKTDCTQWSTELLSQTYDYSVSVDNPCWGHFVSVAVTNEKELTDSYRWRGLSHDNIFQSRDCPNNFFPLWVERPWNPDHTDGDPYKASLNSLIMMCSAFEKFVRLEVVVTTDQKELSRVSVGTLDPAELAALQDRNITGHLARTFIDVVNRGIRTENCPDSHKIRWLNYLMKTIEPKIVRDMTNMTHIPNETYIVSAFEDVYRRLFAINLKLSEKTVIDLGEPKTVSVPAILQVRRVDVNTLMFCLALAIILIIMVVLVFLYWRHQQPVGYLPEHLAGMYAFLYASNAKEECGEMYGRNPAERAKCLEEVGGMYEVGWSPDGQHYGVHRTGKLACTELEEK